MNKKQIEKRVLRTIEKAISLSFAIAFGKRVKPSVIAKRVEVCSKCENVQYKGKFKVMRCSVCNCPLTKDNRLLNLAGFQETRHYGCKHPDGSKWKGL